MTIGLSWRQAPALLAAPLVLLSIAGSAAAQCLAERPAAMAPSDPALCESLEAAVRAPSALPLDQYQAKLDAYLGNYCHRNRAIG